MSEPETLRFRRNCFETHLPQHYLYTSSHFWLREAEPGLVEVGVTEFFTRLLGEVVEFDFEIAPGTAVDADTLVGWIEGLKTMTDVYSVASGTFAGSNPKTLERVDLLTTDAYGDGWLYAVRGRPGEATMDAPAYVRLLDEVTAGMEARSRQPCGDEDP